MKFFNTLYFYVDSLKWPISIGIFSYYFRIELKQILRNGFSLKHGSIEFNFPQARQDPVKEKNNNDIEKTVKSKNKEEIQRLLDDNQSKDNQIFKFKLEKNFEYIYRIIFKSQIILLNNLQVITDGFSRIQLNDYLINIKKTLPVLANSTTEQYLKFLFDQNLVENDRVTGKVKLTVIGDLFLKYIVLNQYNYEFEKSL